MSADVRRSLAVAAGSGVGGMLRHGCGTLLGAGALLPEWLGVIAINAVGCAVIGWYGAISARSRRWGTGPLARHFVIAGVLAGYTSYSLFATQTWLLIAGARYAAAVGSVAGTAVICLGAVGLGHWLGRSRSLPG